ncbi:RNA polymerase sigma factor [Candidatus Nomurabacteria bacterium]|nr:RNA polymerase sigma factor [Candidatus Nomurabacteria bacterium]
MDTEKYLEKTDEDLASLCASDGAIFEVLINRYSEKLSRYIRRRSSASEEDVKDILQNVFIKAYMNINSFDGDFKFQSWIYRICHNEIIDWYRKNKSRKEDMRIDFESGVVEKIASDIDVFDIISTNYDADNIKEALSKLSDKYKELIVLRYFEDKEYDEISDILKIPIGTVSGRLNRAKVKLKEIFLEENGKRK